MHYVRYNNIRRGIGGPGGALSPFPQVAHRYGATNNIFPLEVEDKGNALIGRKFHIIHTTLKSHIYILVYVS